MGFRSGGDVWGTHRVVEPRGVLPQAAVVLDAGLPAFENELLVRVSFLQIDSASFRELSKSAAGDVHAAINSQITEIVNRRGKMHNPVTNSGGVFLGEVEAVGPHHPLQSFIKPGDRVVSLVSLTLTPLVIDKIISVQPEQERVQVKGHAIVFASGQVARLPDDLPTGVTLAALDVCGAPSQLKRHTRRGDTVLILGLGKAGRAMVVKAQQLGLRVLGVDADAKAVKWCEENISGTFGNISAGDAMAVFHWVEQHTAGRLVDAAFQAVNVDGAEMSTILPVREGGTAVFFGMRTSFQKSVLGAEGVGRDVNLIMGSGYVPGHAEEMLNLVRSHPALREWFTTNFS